MPRLRLEFRHFSGKVKPKPATNIDGLLWKGKVVHATSHIPYRSIKSGWWLTYPSAKYELKSDGMIIPNIWKHRNHVPNHQPELSSDREYLYWICHHFLWLKTVPHEIPSGESNMAGWKSTSCMVFSIRTSICRDFTPTSSGVWLLKGTPTQFFSPLCQIDCWSYKLY